MRTGDGTNTSALEVDININNTSGVYNSHLLSHCTLFDERFPALALMIKHWGLNAGIVDAQNGRINRYVACLTQRLKNNCHFQLCARPPSGALPAVRRVTTSTAGFLLAGASLLQRGAPHRAA